MTTSALPVTTDNILTDPNMTFAKQNHDLYEQWFSLNHFCLYQFKNTDNYEVFLCFFF